MVGEQMGSGRTSTDGASLPLPEPLPATAARSILSGKYQLLASVGRGGMAEVMLGVAQGPRGFKKLVVVKRLHTHLAAEQESHEHFVTMFFDEARLSARLNHPNIVTTYEVGEHEGAVFIVMEFLDGQSVRNLLRATTRRQAHVPLPIAVHIVIEALMGLHYAHELKNYDGSPLAIVHRDISPHNLFITYEGAVKLVDFGIAKATLNTTVTSVGTFKGKPGYMSPEQLDGHCDRRTDVFSMGIVLYELATGTRMLSGDVVQAMHRWKSGQVPRACELRPEIDPTLEGIIERATQPTAEDRYASAEEMRQALEEWLNARAVRTGAKEVKAFVNELFDETRKKTEKYIETLMAVVEADEDSDTMRKAKGAAGTPPSDGVDLEPKTKNLLPNGIRPKRSTPTWLNRRFAIAVVCGLACLVAGALLGLSRPGHDRRVAAPPLVAAESLDRPRVRAVRLAPIAAPVATARVAYHSSKRSPSARSTRIPAAVTPPPVAPTAPAPPERHDAAEPESVAESPQRPRVKIIEDVKPKVRILE